MPDHPPERRSRRRTRTTITEVATLAKASPASVSRYLHAPDAVSPELAERIAGALRTTGYTLRRPVPAAPSGQPPIPRLVVFLTLGELTSQDLLALPAFPQLFAGITRRLQAGGGNLLFTNYPGDGPLPAVISEGSVDGILVFGRLARMPAALTARLLATPSAWVMRQHSDHAYRIDHVFYDNTRVGRMAADHLAGLGLRRLAVINSYPEHEAYAPRQAGFLAACRDLGLEATSRSTGLGEAVRTAMRGADRPDGIFVPSDEQLLEVHHLLRSLGIEPGRQVHLIGCNNDPQLMVRMHPRPATIDIHLDLIGARAVEQLAYRLANRDAPPMQVFINPTVVPAER